MQLYKGGGKMKYKSIVVVNDNNDNLICSKQFFNDDKEMEFIKKYMDYKDYKINIYCVKVDEI